MGIENWWRSVSEQCGGTEVFVFVFLLGVAFGGGIYLLWFLLSKLRSTLEKRRREKESARRRLQFELPDRENSYIRTRLNTVLKIEPKLSEEMSVEYGETSERPQEAGCSFGYARKLLAKVKEAPLTVIERAQTEEIGKLFGLYLKKTAWNANDVTVLSDAFSSVLKLSAKYAVSEK